MRAILTYHSLDASGSPISLDPARFRAHVDWLASGRVHVVPLAELLTLPPENDAVALTFDDGFENFATVAWPLLEAAGLPATLFVVSAWVGHRNAWPGGAQPLVPDLPLLDWDALGRLAGDGVGLGSHGATHAPLDRLGTAALDYEVEASAERIEERTGVRPAFFCYPFGRSSPAAVERVRDHYDGAVTTELRSLAPGDDPHRLPRLDSYYFRAPGSLEAWGSAALRRRLWLRERARRVRRGRRPTIPRLPAVPAAASSGAARSDAPPRASVTIVVPVLNEAHVLARSIDQVRRFLARHPDWTWRVAIVDNGSTDGTDVVARQLSERFPEVETISLGKRGRGGALRQAWLTSPSDIVCYTDVDLSTDLEALPRLIAAIHDEGYDVATGSRLMRGSKTVRGVKREVISRIYNLLVKVVLRTSFSDAQCGFKAVSRRAVHDLVPRIVDDSWFFDTELLVLAERAGYRIKDVPITWVEDDDSRVMIIRTGWEDVKGVWRLRSDAP